MVPLAILATISAIHLAVYATRKPHFFLACLLAVVATAIVWSIRNGILLDHMLNARHGRITGF